MPTPAGECRSRTRISLTTNDRIFRTGCRRGLRRVFSSNWIDPSQRLGSKRSGQDKYLENNKLGLIEYTPTIALGEPFTGRDGWQVRIWSS